MNKVTIEIVKGEYNTPDFGNEYAIVKWHNQEIHRTGWYTNGARGEAEIWCRLNGYSV